MRLDHLLLSTDEVVSQASAQVSCIQRIDPQGDLAWLMSRIDGALAQLGEHLLCKQGVVGSIPISSTKFRRRREHQRCPQMSDCAAASIFAISVSLTIEYGL